MWRAVFAGGKRHLQLVTVAPAQQGARTDMATSPRDETKLPKATAAKLRAIAERAPEPVRQLYRDGLIGQDVAAKLGPKSPTPDDAKRIHEDLGTSGHDGRKSSQREVGGDPHPSDRLLRLD